jgi:hypothetical protein
MQKVNISNLINAKLEEETKSSVTQEHFNALQNIRDLIHNDEWAILTDGHPNLPVTMLMLICVDFFKSFDTKIFVSTKKSHYTSRSKHNLRRLKLMQWVTRFVRYLKKSAPSDETMNKCYMWIAKLLIS